VTVVLKRKKSNKFLNIFDELISKKDII